MVFFMNWRAGLYGAVMLGALALMSGCAPQGSLANRQGSISIPAADPLSVRPVPDLPAALPMIRPETRPGMPAMPSGSGADTMGIYLTYPALQAFIAQMQSKHGFDPVSLQGLFAQVTRGTEVLAKVQKPAESKAWYQYRPIFITEDRINQGVAFWQQHAAVLDAAAGHFGVDPAYIVAIIGVETLYGRNTGQYNVLQSLTTLSMEYPARGDFYRSELEQFLLLTRDERFNPLALQGSYAGAMGLGQFISSSYRHYALDFNQDRKRDLWSPEDAIGSVANYLSRHQWRRGEGVAVPAYISGQGYARLVSEKPVRPDKSLAQWAAVGVVPSLPLRVGRAALVGLDGSGGKEYWLTGDNFYVITRYNHSHKYAMAVHQLAQAIRQRSGR